jgi:hypothetical protein
VSAAKKTPSARLARRANRIERGAISDYAL